MSFVAAIVCILLAWLLYRYLSADEQPNLPPGPRPLPIVGNVHQMDMSKLYVTFDEWYREFGSVVRVKLLGQQLIVLNTVDVIREALVKQADNFSARPRLFSFTYFTEGVPRGFIATDGWIWKEQRRFALHVLRDFGLGRSLAIEKVGDEVIALMDIFEQDMKGNSGEVNMWDRYKTAIVNIINNMLFGQRYDHGDAEFDYLQRLVTEIFELSAKTFLPDFLPLAQPFGFLYDKKRLNEIFDEFKVYFDKKIAEHEASMIEDEPPGDFTYAYLQEMSRREKSEEGAGSFSKVQLRWGLLDLFGAGFETTSTTLAWWTVFMVRYPEVQKRMRDEIQKEIGGFPQWTDKPRLPYCQAALAETQRLANIVPLGVFHANHDDAVVAGFTIPKRSIVMVNMYSLMTDEKNFPKPKVFDPERFIGTDGTFNDKIEALIPFSTGKRQCLGEGLARLELFLIATNMVWRYHMSAALSGPPSMDPVFQFTLAPQPFNVKLTVANER